MAAQWSRVRGFHTFGQVLAFGVANGLLDHTTGDLAQVPGFMQEVGRIGIQYVSLCGLTIISLSGFFVTGPLSSSELVSRASETGDFKPIGCRSSSIFKKRAASIDEKVVSQQGCMQQ
ncbi:hypothetical protein N7494_005350 [Penicillium frequentans]|uniref:Uncharacterized protein n=1 Tax=Penicillium frequentans TaxID=3151616 RepID=A0AAD6CXS9_9EURO|nr:hypothetical protein N7494_005350 [Penicillium glabrum]